MRRLWRLVGLHGAAAAGCDGASVNRPRSPTADGIDCLAYPPGVVCQYFNLCCHKKAQDVRQDQISPQNSW